MVVYLSAYFAVVVAVVGYQAYSLYQYQNKASRNEELYDSSLAEVEPGIC
ncbi:hypothetical protein [Citrifermentans bremense]|nr:hypothetical protein [Citrifermentans bremense]